MQSRRFRDAEQTLDDIGLDGDQQHLQFSAGRGTQDLVIPNHFGQREGDVLLRFVLDDLRDFTSINRR